MLYVYLGDGMMSSIAFYSPSGHFSMFGELFPQDRRLLRKADDYADGLECVRAKLAAKI